MKALHTPCHTQDSICYFLEDGDQRAVFTGDTLFTGGIFSLAAESLNKTHSDTCKGCGRFFEGDAAQMNKALNETLASLPDDTKVYVSYLSILFSFKSSSEKMPTNASVQSGHEYTKSNVKFLLAISNSDAIKKLQAFAESNKQTQGILTIGDEKVRRNLSQSY